MAFGQIASDRAGGDAKGIRLEGPAWLICVAIGVGVIVWGVWAFRDSPQSPQNDDTAEPFTFGDDSYMDGLWLDCQAGAWWACDELFFVAPIGSDYELVGATCGGVTDGTTAGAC